MTLEQLIRLMEARIAHLNNARATAAANGDVTQVMVIDENIVQTQTTLDQLRTLVV
jgi:hypothetical protein